MFRDLKDCGGFTLIELIFTVAIIAILAAIAIPGFSSVREKAKIALVWADFRNIHRAMEILANDTERWPGLNLVGKPADQEVWDLNSSQAGLVANGGFPNWNGPYIQSVPKDPWGSDYFSDPDYMIGGVNYAVVGTFGPNKDGKNIYDSGDIYLILPVQ